MFSDDCCDMKRKMLDIIVKFHNYNIPVIINADEAYLDTNLLEQNGFQCTYVQAEQYLQDVIVPIAKEPGGLLKLREMLGKQELDGTYKVCILSDLKRLYYYEVSRDTLLATLSRQYNTIIFCYGGPCKIPHSAIPGGLYVDLFDEQHYF